ncbi:hypothetical protein HL658_29805 [Azospirillum sp. RWY-5-1]|uniref:hypothetical protein n=1 Tax=Azospirillum oleiclasticum TaxID=2735135 RepID=UPI0015D48EED|nr:hypothetical protein [Azospirillum oleiclasticum]NYZ16762.1 hypothetical protein [Azospirillum oleiclasticum]
MQKVLSEETVDDLLSVRRHVDDFAERLSRLADASVERRRGQPNVLAIAVNDRRSLVMWYGSADRIGRDEMMLHLRNLMLVRSSAPPAVDGTDGQGTDRA